MSRPAAAIGDRSDSSPGPRTRRLGIDRHFSLAEVLLAVLFDALLAAAILERIQVGFGWNGTPVVFLAIGILTYMVVPFVVVPFYVLSRLLAGSRPRAWHSRRNSVLLALNVFVVYLAMSLFPAISAEDELCLYLVRLVPVSFTLFMLFSVTTGIMNARRKRFTNAGRGTDDGAGTAGRIEGAGCDEAG